MAVNDENGRLRKEIISQVFRIAGKQIRPRWHDLWTLAFASKEVLDKVCNENIGYIFSRQKKLYDLSARLLRDVSVETQQTLKIFLVFLVPFL